MNENGSEEDLNEMTDQIETRIDLNQSDSTLISNLENLGLRKGAKTSIIFWLMFFLL